jgi:acetate kinase
MRELRRRALGGDAQAELAIRIFCRSVVKALAGLIALYDAQTIVFTGGIGEHDPATRAEIAARLSRFGLCLDSAANQGQHNAVQCITTTGSTITSYVIHAEEDLMIARHVAQMCPASLT